ncbi:MAG: hypothetical protein ACOY0T_32885 [Myxococcota bacterium]
MRLVAFASLLLALGCSPREPPEWPRGGAPLLIPSARWDRGEADAIEIRSNGQVLEGGDLVFVVDRVGRVADADYDPLAILLPDGRVVGTDDQYLGQIGVTNAAPPWSTQAWLAVQPDGIAVGFDSDGDRVGFGRWHGCDGPALRTCTLVTHLLILRRHRSVPPSGVRFGVGMGLWL